MSSRQFCPIFVVAIVATMLPFAPIAFAAAPVSTYYDDWSSVPIGSGPDAAWGAENATDPNNGNVHYINNTPAQSATNGEPTTIQVISDPTSSTGRALQMSIVPNVLNTTTTSKSTYYSAEVSTKIGGGGGGAAAGNNIQYGHIEASIKVAGGSGTGADSVWPAFWMLGDDISTVGSTPGVGWPNCGEIDIMETKGSQETVNQAHIHSPKTGGGDTNGGSGVGSTYTLPNSALMYNAYHTYAIDWAPNSITWSIDGVPYLTETNVSTNFTSANGVWEFNGHPFYLILDINQGGSFAATGHNITAPLTMDVAYVSVSAVPEPTSLVLLGLGATALLRRKRR